MQCSQICKYKVFKKETGPCDNRDNSSQQHPNLEATASNGYGPLTEQIEPKMPMQKVHLPHLWRPGSSKLANRHPTIIILKLQPSTSRISKISSAKSLNKYFVVAEKPCDMSYRLRKTKSLLARHHAKTILE